MPLMPETLDELDQFSMFYVMGFMIHPDDEAARTEYMELVEARIGLEIGGTDQLGLSEGANQAAIRALAAKTHQDIAGATKHGAMAGEVLLHVLRSRGHSSNVGVEKAQFLTSEFFRGANRLDGVPYEKNGRGAGRETVLAAWTKFRPVAHFWAAHNLISYKVQDVAPGQEPGLGLACWPLLLSLAQTLLLVASEHPLPPPHSGDKLVPRETAWELGGTTPAERIELPELTADEVDALTNRYEPRYR